MDNTEKRNDFEKEDLDKEWSQIAGEAVSPIALSTEIYTTGSEIACLRLAYRFRQHRIDVYRNSKGEGWYFVKYSDPGHQDPLPGF